MSYEDSDDEVVPSVDNFTEFFPWAVSQFSLLGVHVVIKKMIENEIVSVTRYTVRIRKKLNITSKTQPPKSVLKLASVPNLAENIPTMNIIAYYNKGGYLLIGLKFEKGMTIPRGMVKVLTLIIQFHLSLTSITFVGNADKFVIHELSKLVVASNITEVCLDGCRIKEGNYDLLLKENCNLRILSLARCTITDNVLQLITNQIVFPKPASFTLNILNLSSNRITDVGAGYLATTLRLNRNLYYLNLADNSITDDGAVAIFDVMLEFPVTDEELVDARLVRLQYLKQKSALLHDLVSKTSQMDIESTSLQSDTGAFRRKRSKKVNVTLEESRLLHDTILKNINQASFMAFKALGSYENPISGQFTRDGVIYSAGGNTLQSLNLAYNNLSFISVKKALQVLQHQTELKRKPKGLINLNLEGNPLPNSCIELQEINRLLSEASTAPIVTPVLKKRTVKPSRNTLSSQHSSYIRIK